MLKNFLSRKFLMIVSANDIEKSQQNNLENFSDSLFACKNNLQAKYQ